MRLSRDKVIETLNLVTLQRIEYDFALASVAGINQSSFAGRRDNQDGIAFYRSDVEHVNLQLAGRFRRTRTPPREHPFPAHDCARAQQNYEHCNRTSASSCGSAHGFLPRDSRRSLISTSGSPEESISITPGKADLRSLLRCALEVFPQVIQII